MAARNRNGFFKDGYQVAPGWSENGCS